MEQMASLLEEILAVIVIQETDTMDKPFSDAGEEIETLYLLMNAGLLDDPGQN